MADQESHKIFVLVWTHLKTGMKLIFFSYRDIVISSYGVEMLPGYDVQGKRLSEICFLAS